MIQPADRLSLVQEYYFSRKLKEVAQLNAEGRDIISLAIGSPDMPPSEQTIEKLCEVARQPNAHGYQPTQGTPELRQAMADFYKRWYDVDRRSGRQRRKDECPFVALRLELEVGNNSGVNQFGRNLRRGQRHAQKQRKKDTGPFHFKTPFLLDLC